MQIIQICNQIRFCSVERSNKCINQTRWDENAILELNSATSMVVTAEVNQMYYWSSTLKSQKHPPIVLSLCMQDGESF